MANDGKRVALVLGNAAYAHASTLVNPLNDARAIAASLTRIGFSGIPDDESVAKGSDPRVGVLPFADVDYNRLRRLLATFARLADSAEQAILYYAGHGIEVNGQNYLIPVDARLLHVREVDFQTASLMQILNAVEGARGLRLVILDACRDNPFRDRLFGTRNISRGLREVEPGRNILVGYAAKHGTVAMDGDGGNSPYAAALVQHLEKPGLEIMDLFREVKDAVLEATGERQEPYVYGSLGRRREYLVKPPVSSGDGDWREQEYWRAISSSEAASDFEQFLAAYPNSQLASLAQRNAERCVRLCSDLGLLHRFVKQFPDSPRSELAKVRIADLTLPKSGRAEELRSAPEAALAAELPGTPPPGLSSGPPPEREADSGTSPAIPTPIKPPGPTSRRAAFAMAAVTALALAGVAFAILRTPDQQPTSSQARPPPQTASRALENSNSSPQPPIVVSTIKKYDTGATDTEIKIGNIMPYSGPASAYGAVGKTQDAYFRKINAAGGVNGRKINFISYDDAYSPPKSVEQIRKLVESDETLLIFSPLGTPPNNAIQKYLNAKQIPQLFVASGATKWGDPQNFPWTMGWQPSYQAEARVYARYIFQNLTNGRIAVMYQNDEFGKDYIKGVRDALGPMAPSMIVAEESYELSESNIDAHIVKLKASGADIFIDVATPKFAAQAIRKINDLGWKPMHFLTSVSASVGAVIKPAGMDKSQGIISAGYAMDPTDPQWRDTPAMKEWVAFMEQFNLGVDKTDSLNVFGYNLARTLVQVLKQCGDELTRDNVMKQAAHLKDFEPGLLLPGIKINTSPTDFYPIEQLQLMRFEGETWKLFGPVLSGAMSR